MGKKKMVDDFEEDFEDDEEEEEKEPLVVESWIGDVVDVSVALYYECIKGKLIEVNANGITLKEGKYTTYISWDKINFLRKKNE